jgi:hypothetical protein
MNYHRMNRHFKEALRRAAENKRRLHEGFMRDGGYTEPFITQSAAGFYLGTWYRDTDYGGFWCPGSRDSGYYATKEDAQKAFPWAETDVKTVLERAGTEYASGPGIFLPRKTLDAWLAQQRTVETAYADWQDRQAA